MRPIKIENGECGEDLSEDGHDLDDFLEFRGITRHDCEVIYIDV